MNYTDEDVLDFIVNHRWYYSKMSDDYLSEGLCCVVTLDGKKRKIYKEDFVERVTKEGSPIYHDGLSDFLHRVSLEDVPLWINRYPELAKWRLRIAK